MWDCNTFCVAAVVGHVTVRTGRVFLAERLLSHRRVGHYTVSRRSRFSTRCCQRWRGHTILAEHSLLLGVCVDAHVSDDFFTRASSVGSPNIAVCDQRLHCYNERIRGTGRHCVDDTSDTDPNVSTAGFYAVVRCSTILTMPPTAAVSLACCQVHLRGRCARRSK